MSDDGGVVFPVLDEHIYVEVIWFVAYDDADMIAMVFRHPRNGPWQLRYRFRHYHDDKVWDSEDRKSMYDIEAPPEWEKPRDRLIALMDSCVTSAMVEVGAPVVQKRLVVKGDGYKAGDLLMKQPFAHAKTAGSWRPTDQNRRH